MTSQYESGLDAALDDGFDGLFRENTLFASAEPLDTTEPHSSKPSGCHPIRWYNLPFPVRHFLQRPEPVLLASLGARALGNTLH